MYRFRRWRCSHRLRGIPPQQFFMIHFSFKGHAICLVSPMGTTLETPISEEAGSRRFFLSSFLFLIEDGLDCGLCVPISLSSPHLSYPFHIAPNPMCIPLSLHHSPMSNGQEPIAQVPWCSTVRPHFVYDYVVSPKDKISHLTIH